MREKTTKKRKTVAIGGLCDYSKFPVGKEAFLIR